MSDVRLLVPITAIPTIYLIIGLGFLRGFSIYLVPSIIWLLVFFVLFSYDPVPRETSKAMVMLGFAVGLIHVALLFNIALMITGMGKTPYSLTPLGLAINAFFVYSRVLGMEFSRALIIKKMRRRPALAVAVTAIVFAVVLIPLQSIFVLASPKDITIFLASKALPLIAQSALASYLALIGGPWASIAYISVVEAVMHYSPYLPSMGWMWSSLVGVMIPIIGFIIINMALALSLPRMNRKHVNLKNRVRKGSLSLVTVSMLVLVMWASMGAFGAKPIVILGDSMKPTINVGDIVIVGKISPSSIKPGDIIQYYREGIGVITHRVAAVEHNDRGLYFVTKGDALDEPDPWLVPSDYVIGKVIFVIPKIGWITIALRSIPQALISLFSG
ncbi:MAG: signal peptidase I [Candidatus Nezhaarchaeales archaeon]